MDRKAIHYLENHYKFSVQSDSNSATISSDLRSAPTLEPVFLIPERLIAFSEIPKRNISVGQVSGCGVGVHFYEHDYRFNNILRCPNKYVQTLKNYQCVFTPDISLYRDMDIIDQAKNSVQSKVIGRLLQDEGISVIPTVSWSDERSFEFCFDGLPVGSVVSVSSVGIMRDKTALNLFELGYNEMLQRLGPSLVLFYGALPKINLGTVPIRQYDNTNYVWTKNNLRKNKEER